MTKSLTCNSVIDASISGKLRITFDQNKIPPCINMEKITKDGVIEFFGTCFYLRRQKKHLTLSSDLTPEEARAFFHRGEDLPKNHPSNWNTDDILCVSVVNPDGTHRTIYKKDWTDNEALLAANQAL